MFMQYITKKLQQANYKILEDGLYYGEIPQVRGVWASAKSLEKCRQELQEVLEDWTLLQVAEQRKVQGLSVKTASMRREYA